MLEAMEKQKLSGSGAGVALVAMGAVAMSYGWGFRGDYGHEFGAMIPGALLAMGAMVMSGNAAWHGRYALLGALGALGWAWGGSQSYGMITSYTVSYSYPDVVYGYSALFTVGMLWGGIGGAILSLGLTKSLQDLRNAVLPVAVMGGLFAGVWALGWLVPEFRIGQETIAVKYLDDIDWLAATPALSGGVVCWLIFPKSRHASGLIVCLAAAWWIGYLVLIKLFALEMTPTPPGKIRSENWSGVIALFIVWVIYMLHQKNRAGLMLTLYGAMAGGLGFFLGDFINKPDKVHWEPFWQHECLRGFDHWKWTEQSFGLIMGLGVSLGLLRLLRGNLAVENHDEPRRRQLNLVGAFFLLVGMQWMYLRHNVYAWKKEPIGFLTDEPLFGVPGPQWFAILGAALSLLACRALWLHYRNRLPLAPASKLGRGQFIFLFVMYASNIAVFTKAIDHMQSKGMLFVHGSFWVSCFICTWLMLKGKPVHHWSDQEEVSPEDARWKLGWKHWLLWVLCPLLILTISAVTMKMHDAPIPGSRLRFGPDAYHLTGKTLE